MPVQLAMEFAVAPDAPPFTEDYTVSVHAVVDDFDLEPGPPVVRRISLGQSQLGDGQDVELAVVSDKTFVPAKLAGVRSSDARQLGVRVFRAFVQPKQ
jgi:hypothetical protein